MITDKQKLEKIQKELAESEYFQHNVLKDLLNAIDKTTEKLNKELNIPQFERDDQYLFSVLEKDLGYNVQISEEYNGYFQCFCYKIKLC